MAIVVPDAEVLGAWAKNNGIEGDIKQLCENKVKHFFLNNTDFSLSTLRIRIGQPRLQGPLLIVSGKDLGELATFFLSLNDISGAPWKGNPRQSWILDYTLWTPDSRYWISNFPTLNKISSMKTKILDLKDVNSKITDSLLNRAAVSF